MKTEQELKSAGFTDSGVKRYTQTTTEYCETLYTKASNFGEADKADGLPREVTHDHVKAAAHAIANSYGRAGQTPFQLFMQVVEYICTAFAGLCAGKLETQWGAPGFVLSVALGIGAFVVRNTRR